MVDTRTPNSLVEIWQGEGASSVDVSIQDQTSPLINVFFLMGTGAPTTTTTTAAIDDMGIDIADATGFSAGTYVGIFSNTSRFYFANVTEVDGLTLTLDTPLDFEFPIGSQVLPTTRNLAVDGSTTPKVFSVNGADSFDIDITRLIFTMTLSGTPDDGKFGDIAGGIANGLVLRRTDGTTRNIFNVKDNGELAGVSYDLAYTARSGGAGDHGLRCRYTFAGQSKQGVAIRLGADERLEMIVSDDLTSLGRFRVLAEGHEVLP